MEEKKVEFIELIYDLIFVYLIGCNNELLHNTEGGFFTAQSYITYLISAAVILQIWYLSTLFINRYGTDSLTDYIGLFINMYLLYYMANSSGAESGEYYMRYNIAWGLILVNLAVQYFIQLKKNSKIAPWELVHIKSRMILLLIEALIVFISVPIYYTLHIPLAWAALIIGFLGGFFTRKIDALVPVNFEHLTERVMLYIVLTFGEMIVSIAGYFESAFSLNTLYFSLMAFLIAAGLFLSYGYMYNNIIDRSRQNAASPAYMMLHIVLLLALSNITAALEFMREPAVSAVPKNILITISFLIYYLFLFLICSFSKYCDRPKRKLLLMFGAASVLFMILMSLFYSNGYINVAVSVLYVFGVFAMMAGNYKKALFSHSQI